MDRNYLSDNELLGIILHNFVSIPMCKSSRKERRNIIQLVMEVLERRKSPWIELLNDYKESENE